MTTSQTTNPANPPLPGAVPTALVDAAVDLGLDAARFRDLFLAWSSVYTATGVAAAEVPRLAAERAIAEQQQLAQQLPHPQFNVPAAPPATVQVHTRAETTIASTQQGFLSSQARKSLLA